jgi:hypothetical protein
MRVKVTQWLEQLNAQRAIALAIGPGLVAIGLDAAISHIAGRRELVLPAQYIPVLFAPAACLALIAFAVPRLGPALFGFAVRAVGVAGIAVGLLGTGFHVRALLRLLEGSPLSLDGLEAALAVAPPLFAPGAFVGIGAVLWMIGNPSLVIRLSPRPAVVAPVPVLPLPGPMAPARKAA